MIVPEIDIRDNELAKHPEQLGVVTTTYYPNWYRGELKSDEDTDKVRGDLALTTLTKSHHLHHPTWVIDGTGENTPFWEELHKLNINVFPQQQKGMDSARQEGFKLAGDDQLVSVITWTEPEKVSFLDQACLWTATLPVVRGTYDLVIPARDEKGFMSYPAFQASSEKRLNARFNKLLHIPSLLKRAFSLFSDEA